MRFSHIIREQRIALGISQGELGKKIGTSQSFISHIEIAEDEVSVTICTCVLRKLCHAFHLSFPEVYAQLNPDVSDIIVREKTVKYGTKAEADEARWTALLRSLPEEVRDRLIYQAEIEKKMLEETIRRKP